MVMTVREVSDDNYISMMKMTIHMCDKNKNTDNAITCADNSYDYGIMKQKIFWE